MQRKEDKQSLAGVGQLLILSLRLLDYGKKIGEVPEHREEDVGVGLDQ